MNQDVHIVDKNQFLQVSYQCIWCLYTTYVITNRQKLVKTQEHDMFGMVRSIYANSTAQKSLNATFFVQSPKSNI